MAEGQLEEVHSLSTTLPSFSGSKSLYVTIYPHRHFTSKKGFGWAPAQDAIMHVMHLGIGGPCELTLGPWTPLWVGPSPRCNHACNASWDWWPLRAHLGPLWAPLGPLWWAPAQDAIMHVMHLGKGALSPRQRSPHASLVIPIRGFRTQQSCTKRCVSKSNAYNDIHIYIYIDMHMHIYIYICVRMHMYV